MQLVRLPKNQRGQPFYPSSFNIMILVYSYNSSCPRSSFLFFSHRDSAGLLFFLALSTISIHPIAAASGFTGAAARCLAQFLITWCL